MSVEFLPKGSPTADRESSSDSKKAFPTLEIYSGYLQRASEVAYQVGSLGIAIRSEEIKRVCHTTSVPDEFLRVVCA